MLLAPRAPGAGNEDLLNREIAVVQPPRGGATGNVAMRRRLNRVAGTGRTRCRGMHATRGKQPHQGGNPSEAGIAAARHLGNDQVQALQQEYARTGHERNIQILDGPLPGAYETFPVDDSSSTATLSIWFV